MCVKLGQERLGRDLLLFKKISQLYRLIQAIFALLTGDNRAAGSAPENGSLMLPFSGGARTGTRSLSVVSVRGITGTVPV